MRGLAHPARPGAGRPTPATGRTARRPATPSRSARRARPLRRPTRPGPASGRGRWWPPRSDHRTQSTSGTRDAASTTRSTGAVRPVSTASTATAAAPDAMAARSAVVPDPAPARTRSARPTPTSQTASQRHAQAPQQVLGGEDRADAVGAHALRHGRGADALERGQLALGGVRIHEPPQQSDRTVRQRANQMVPTEQGRVDGIRVDGRRAGTSGPPAPSGAPASGAGW